MITLILILCCVLYGLVVFGFFIHTLIEHPKPARIICSPGASPELRRG